MYNIRDYFSQYHTSSHIHANQKITYIFAVIKTFLQTIAHGTLYRQKILLVLLQSSSTIVWEAHLFIVIYLCIY